MISLKNLADLHGYYCHYCRVKFDRRLEKATRDHVIPRAKGGSSRIENLVLSCEWCNLRKREMDYDEFMVVLPDLLYVRWGNDPQAELAEGVVPKLLEQPAAAPIPRVTAVIEYQRAMSNVSNRARWSAEKFPLTEVGRHVNGLGCACGPRLQKIRCGWRVLEHQEIPPTSRTSSRVVQ